MLLIHRIWRLLPEGFRASFRRGTESLGALGDRARLWRWRLASIHSPLGETVFLGRSAYAGEVAELLGQGTVGKAGRWAAIGALRSGLATIVSEAYLPGALRVPRNVFMVFPAHSGRMKLPNRRRARASEHHIRRITEDAEIERISRDFLVPFAIDRHGTAANQLALTTVKKLAEYGRLDVLTHGDEEVGAHLGFSSVLNGKRHWVCCRVGYPRKVYEDPRRLTDVNTINFFLHLRQSEDAGFDFYDLGDSVARPEGGLLQFKKRMGAVLTPGPWHDCFWVRPPRGKAPEMLWNAPLFSLERRGLVLNLGLPDGLREGAAKDRCRALVFDGLASVRIHLGSHIPSPVLDELTRHFGAIPVEFTSSSRP